MTRWPVLAALACGCWTGPDAPPPAAPQPATHVHHHPRFELTLERTSCMGMCPVYKIVIHPDGDVEWTGVENVAEVGVRHSRISAARFDELARALDVARFDERDESGAIPLKAVCAPAASGSAVSCSISGSITVCTDTSRTILTVRRGAATHTVENDHCEPSPLDSLEEHIDRIVHASAWVGR